jgi:DUF4097 and DUF4098 domain-containing protein YvlB
MKRRALQLVFVLLLMPAMVWAAGDESRTGDQPEKTERSTAAQSSVTVSLCVQSSNVVVNGWDKDEVQVTSSEGALLQFKREAGADESKPAAKLEVMVVDKEDTRRGEFRCQAASDVQLSVPHGATVQIQTRDGSIQIAHVAVAYAGTQDGDVVLEKISSSAEVGTIGGSITISDSTGRIDLNTIGGTVVACNVRPTESSESFEVTTVSGDIEITEVSHSIMNLRTTTGDMMVSGPLAAGGKYGIGTMSGNVTLALPSDASFQLTAKIAANGDIITDFPLTILSQSVSSGTSKASAKSPKASSQSPVPAQPKATAAATAQGAPAPPVASTPAPPATPAAPAAQTPAAPPATPVPPQADDKIIVKVDPKISVVIPKEAMIVTVNPGPEPVIKANPIIINAHSLRRVSAICGSGDATISVASFSGTLHLQRND